MLEYETLKPLFKFLQVPKNSKKHWAKLVLQEVLKVIRAIVGATCYPACRCDEVFVVDNQSWLYVHCYVMHNWVRIPILISLDQVVEGSRNDKMTKVIMEALIIGGGVPRNQIA
jgi:hypothetical protein